jgi:acetate kinase
VRARIAEYLAWLGIALDDAANAKAAEQLSPGHARVRVWRFVADEEREIAAACAAASAAG